MLKRYEIIPDVQMHIFFICTLEYAELAVCTNDQKLLFVYKLFVVVDLFLNLVLA